MSITESALALISIGLIQLLAVISPGPSFLIVARTAVARSRGDGIRLAVGMAAGTVIWSSAALIGLNSVFKAMPLVFTVMKAVGALFLLWIAWQTVKHAKDPLEINVAGDVVSRNPYLQGFLTQISNPKVAVFFGSIFIAILPADVPGWMVIGLITIVSFNEFWWYSAVAICCGSAPIRAYYIKIKSTVDRVTGLFLGGLGIKLLVDAA